MKRLNITIDEDLYKKLRALSYIRNESISNIIRLSLRDWIKNIMGKKEEIILSAQDEEDILEILEKDELISIDDVKKNLDL
ncbi:MAG: ribbon-helix-helix protein, CopG family [Candidatus Aminicenantes bacterium]|nr:ribbon-helix-helix protein, CopG family [Candidatus Aminicenantes bacterium]